MSIAEGLSGIFEDPSLLNRANTWSQTQTWKANQLYEGTTFYAGEAVLSIYPSMSQAASSYAYWGQFTAGNNANAVDGIVPGVIFWNNKGGTGFGGVVGNVSMFNSIKVGVTPSLSAPSITSGTVYQNTSASYQTLYVPAYASTSGTSGTVALALGTSSSPSTIATEYVSGNTSSSATVVLTVRIPPQWYYSLTTSGATLGTVTQIQE